MKIGISLDVVSQAKGIGSSGGGSASSTQWRLLFDNSLSGNLVSVSEVEMRAIAGGADQCNGGTAAASSIFSGSYTADKAFDNLTNGEMWHSGTEATSWLRYTFPSAVSVTQISIRARDSNGGDPEVRSFSVQYYDGSSWVTSWSETTPAWTASETRLFTKP